MKLNEFKTTDEQDLYEMANLTSRYTGIDRVVIWVGMDYKRHAMRVKVSNVPNKMADDTFIITIPDLDVIGKIDKSFISGKTLNDIKSWLKLNIQTLIDYESGKLVDTGDFLDQLVQIN